MGTYTKYVVTSGQRPAEGYPDYGQAKGIRIAIGVYMPSPNPNGRKHQAIIWHHGIGEVGTIPVNDTDYNGVDVIRTVDGCPRETVAGDLPLVGINGSTHPDDQIGTAIIFAQCADNYGTWPFCYRSEEINLILNNLPEIDPQRIHGAGYSFGGGSSLRECRDPFINDHLASMHAISAGYNYSQDYPYIARSGLPIYAYHSKDDPTAPYTITSSFARNLQNQGPVHALQYYEFSGETYETSGHNRLVDLIVGRNVPTVPQKMTNGDYWTPTKTMYELCAYHTVTRRKRQPPTP